MSLDLIFKALSDSTRRKILRILLEKDLTAGEIAKNFQQSWPTISHHLEVLKSAGLITSEKQGQYIVYSLNTTVFQEIVSWILENIGEIKESGKEDEESVQSR
ncbi:TPA: winged helix-turn-helix transcriptional regulator [bacterium]|nr:winged helix-turn-helix transcriptional regulator [bacterium]